MNPLPLPLSVLLALVSGAAGLAWQGLWTVQLAAVLGHEWMAALGVMGALFIGMAAGARWLAPRAERSAQAGRWFAALEAIIGLWGVVLAWTLPPLLPVIAPWVGIQPAAAVHALVSLAVPCLLLLPSTVAMGATWPALSRATQVNHNAMAGVYGAHTAGALIGLLGSVFVLLPSCGLRRSALAIAAVNLLCALVVLPRRSAAPVTAQVPATGAQSGSAPAGLLLALAASGLLGIGYETLCIRILSQVGENTVYSYALMVGVFLLGTAGGAWLRLPRLVLSTCVLVTGGAVALAGTALWWAADIAGWGTLSLGWLIPGTVAGELCVALCVLLVPALAMGVSFTALCRAALGRGHSLGHALSANLLGAAIAPALVGVLGLPWLGPATSFIVLVSGYGLLALGLAAPDWSRTSAWPALLFSVASLALAPWLAPLRHIDSPAGSQVLRHIDGPMAAVTVTQDERGVRRLQINNRVQEGSSAASPIEARLALLPLMWHPQPQRALFLGWGTGYTARIAALDGSVQVQAVELLPEVIRASALFDDLQQFPATRAAIQLVPADARRFALASGQHYDLIVADLFHPARSGAGSLYTVEHYRALRSRLAPGGLVCQWLALYQMELPTLRAVVAAFRSVFPDAVLVLASNSLDTPVVGLVSRPDRGWAGPDAVAQRLANAPADLQRELQRARLLDAAAVLGSVMGGASVLQGWLGDTIANSDDRPVVTYGAPWDTYRPQTTPAQRLGLLLTQWPIPDSQSLQADLGWPPPEAAGAQVSSAQLDELAAYLRARNGYLRLGLARPDLASADGRNAVALELRALLSLSPQFTPAADALRALQPSGTSTALPPAAR